MRREFVFRLVGDPAVRRFRSNQGDRLKTEREFAQPVDELFSLSEPAEFRARPYAFLIHTHLSVAARGDGTKMMSLRDFAASTLPGSLHSFAIPAKTGDEWMIFGTDWTVKLVGEPEPREPFRPVFGDFVGVESRFNMSPFTALSSAEGQANVVHAHLLREAQASGGSVLDHGSFAEGEADGALEWVEITEPVAADDLDQADTGEDDVGGRAARPFEVVSF